ncbi:thiamine pyrophosphate-binding protein [Undibacterium arcticum]|uniref:thiamine pyrophosphate-binding protein n=1 Tax=Undibacterium arcticum TaxID=1762892 RepID=UPI003611FC2A
MALKGALVAGAGAAAGSVALVAPTESVAQTIGPKPASAHGPSSQTVAAETMGSGGQPMAELGAHIANPGSDFMVDVMREADLEYVAIMTASSLRGLQESIVNYGDNKSPQLIVCCHEEAAVGIAHGYAKMAGKPMGAMVHAVVGLQHASMAIYNAWCDRVPVMVIVGNTVDASKRRPGVEWIHTAVDMGAMVRDMVKWDDAPGSLQNYAESFMRARALATTPPMAPVLIVADGELQENPIENRRALKIPKLVQVAPPEGDSETVARIARILVDATHPVIAVDRAARNQEGMDLLVKLAESLNAPVIDLYGRMNFPTTHYLQQSARRGALIKNADVILALEVGDLWGLINRIADIPGRPGSRVAKPDAKVLSISANYLYQKSNYGDVERYYAADITVGADAQTTLPSLIAAIKKLTGGNSSAIVARKKPMSDAWLEMHNDARKRATAGWDASPISTARLCMEIWNQIKNEPKWSLVSDSQFGSNWPQLLWEFTEFKQFIGGSGGYGIGYALPAAAGAALACKSEGRLAVNIQTDGELLMVPTVLWTLAHHKIPLLTIMHNNRAWHQETMHLQRMGTRRDRDATSWRIGTLVEEPYVDYATMAKSMGVWAEGPITDPALLGPAIARALAVVKSGLPALVDVVTQPR